MTVVYLGLGSNLGDRESLRQYGKWAVGVHHFGMRMKVGRQLAHLFQQCRQLCGFDACIDVGNTGFVPAEITTPVPLKHIPAMLVVWSVGHFEF